MKTSLLVSTYNWPEALELVFKSVENQTVKPDEFLIADDGSKLETKELIDSYIKKTTIPVVHVWHEDEGFRRSSILNKAIAKANGDYIIQTDGDCIMHKDFIKDHKANAIKNCYLYGSRVSILESYLDTLFSTKKMRFHFFSKGIKKRGRTLRIPFLAKLYRPKNTLSDKLRGCNLSFWKQDFIAVNGYNEAMTGWGREDSELIVRMLNKGIKGKRLKFGGIVYHIWHKTASQHNFNKNDEIQKEAIEKKHTWCENGINQYL
ncbi:MAG: glycosyltransferase family 2 protein [Flavobacteriaceae bacterium]|nr:glycosyltransferase family 2 protein [Flavobacteriaceae bacterium]